MTEEPDLSSAPDPVPTPEVEASEVEAPEVEAPAQGAAPPAAEAPTPAVEDPEKAAARARAGALYRALRAKRPLEGLVERVIKGGYEIRLGRARGFCPHSQIDLHRPEDPELHVGKSYPFRVVQVRRAGEDVVVSRRALLEDQRIEESKAVRATLVEGAVMQGRVAGLAEFGAFVDLGAGVMGLVHVSEISHRHVARVADAVRAGDPIAVRIMKLHEDGKISLSARRAVPDPWEGAAERWAPSTVHEGRVTRLADFGAFVELVEGVEALAPASEFPPTAGGWRQGLEPGAARRWRVLSVDPRRRRISVAPPEAAELAAASLEPGAVLKGRVQRVERFGVFVWLGPGRVGLMPGALSGTPRETDLAARFPEGDEIEVEVLEVSEDGRRIRLAKPGAAAVAEPPDPGPPLERAPRRERRERNGERERRQRRDDRDERPARTREPAPADGVFGTSLGEKLRAAFERSGGRG